MSTETQTPATDANNQPAPAVAPAPAAGADTLLTAPAAPAATDPAAAAQPAGEKPTEAKPAEAKPAEGGEQKPEEKPQGAPEEYAEFTAPEGVAFNPEVMTEFKAFAKEKNLTQEDAQKLVDIATKSGQANTQAFQQQIEQVQAQWAEAARTDKEFGGDKLAENMAVAKRTLDTFGTPELSKLLVESKLGNHPEIIRTFYRVGKAISEDKLVTGSTKPAGGDALKAMYPTMNQS